MWMVCPGATPVLSATRAAATCLGAPGGCATAGSAVAIARSAPARTRIIASSCPARWAAIWRGFRRGAKRGSTSPAAPGHHPPFGFRSLEVTPVPAAFDDIQIGQVVSLGAAAVEPEALKLFASAFTPGWTVDRGAPDSMVYAIWARLDAVAHTDWPQTKRLGVDALRWVRNPPAGELLRGRMTIMAKDPVGDGKGIIIAQHDLLDEAGRLVFSCLTRSVFAR